MIKKVYLSLLLFLSILFCGCTVNTTPDLDKSVSKEELDLDASGEKDSSEEKEEDEAAEKKDSSGIYLELCDVIDYCPNYFVRIKMMDGEESIAFDEDPNIDIEPSAMVYDFGYYFEDEDNPNDTLVAGFWAVDGTDSLTIIVDGLKCVVELPLHSPEEVTLNQTLTLPDGALTMEKAYIYPNSLLLYMRGENNTELLDNLYLLKTEKSEKHGMSGIHQDDSGNGMVLFVFEDGFTTDQIYSLKVGHRDAYSEFTLSL